MTYQAIINQLDSVGLKTEFVKEFEQSVTKPLLEMVRASDKLHSPGSLIRTLMKQYENESERWLFWQKVLFYFMFPEFVRVKNF